MKIDSVLASGLQGIQRGLQSADANAVKVSQAFRPESDQDAVEPLIGLKLASHQVKASAKVIKAGDEMFDSVLSILA